MPCSRELHSNKRGCGGGVSTWLPGFLGTGRAREVANTKRVSKSSSTFIYSNSHPEPSSSIRFGAACCASQWHANLHDDSRKRWQMSRVGQTLGCRENSLSSSINCTTMLSLCTAGCSLIHTSFVRAPSSAWLVFSEHYFLRKDCSDLLGTLLSPCPLISGTPAQDTGKFEISNFSIKAARS